MGNGPFVPMCVKDEATVHSSLWCQKCSASVERRAFFLLFSLCVIGATCSSELCCPPLSMIACTLVPSFCAIQFFLSPHVCSLARFPCAYNFVECTCSFSCACIMSMLALMAKAAGEPNTGARRGSKGAARARARRVPVMRVRLSPACPHCASPWTGESKHWKTGRHTCASSKVKA